MEAKETRGGKLLGTPNTAYHADGGGGMLIESVNVYPRDVSSGLKKGEKREKKKSIKMNMRPLGGVAQLQHAA